MDENEADESLLFFNIDLFWVYLKSVLYYTWIDYSSNFNINKYVIIHIQSKFIILLLILIIATFLFILSLIT